jgi:hypothetical protein
MVVGVAISMVSMFIFALTTLLLFVVFLFTQRQPLLAQIAKAHGDSSHGH